jgi:hypothetical protein
MTHIQKSDLLSDQHLYAAAIEQAERAEWSMLHELLALNVETADRAIRQAMANAGVKQDKIPAALRIPRPGVKTESDAIVMRPHEFGKVMGSR